MQIQLFNTTVSIEERDIEPLLGALIDHHLNKKPLTASAHLICAAKYINSKSKGIRDNGYWHIEQALATIKEKSVNTEAE